ncbi:hypothetical protein [Bacillus toyonensis]|uniref:hypothetical protein n=1 Tax=Bacillus toyonensis TaxID=155322 RepID=UPI000BF3A739|nr:hypothetical protein [Bacillus toyonensis]PGF05218.1 hypothetical protein COM61_02015 [Bacillus toyonensis]
MSNLNVTNHDDVAYTELTGNSLLVRITPNDSTCFRNNLVTKLNIAIGFDILDNVDTSNVIMYRKDVSIDSSSIKGSEEYCKFFRKDYSTKVLDVVDISLRESISSRRLDEEESEYLEQWGIEEGTDIEVHFKEALKLFLKYKGSDYTLNVAGLNVKHTIEVADIERYLKYLSEDNKLSLFKLLRSRLNTNNSLPINYATKDFIKVKKGKTLVSITVNDDYDSSELINKFVTEINKLHVGVVDFVNFAKERGRIHLGILCDNKDAQDMLDLIALLYSNLYEETSLVLREDFYCNIEIEKNLSHEGYERDIYCIVQGYEFEPITSFLEELRAEDESRYVIDMVKLD